MGKFFDSKSLAVAQANEVLFALMGAFGGYHAVRRETFIQAVNSRFSLRPDMPLNRNEVIAAGDSLMSSDGFWSGQIPPGDPEGYDYSEF
jgi:hypothetical protein